MRAPDVFRLALGIFAQQRHEEGVDGDVFHLLQIALQTLAVAAVRVFKGDEETAAVAVHHLDGAVQRQFGRDDAGNFVESLLRDVDAAVRLDDVAAENIGEFFVNIDHFARFQHHFIQPGHGRFLHRFDHVAGADELVEAALEFIGLVCPHLRGAQQQGSGQHPFFLQHQSSP